MPTEYPDKVIDLHTHIFNCRYVPIVGALHSKIGLPVWIAELIKPVLNILAGGEGFPDIDSEKAYIDSIKLHGGIDDLVGDFHGVTATALSKRVNTMMIDIRIAGMSDKMTPVLASKLAEDDLHRALTDIDNRYRSAVDIAHIIPHEEHAKQIVDMVSTQTLTARADLLGGIGDLFIGIFKDSLLWLFEQAIKAIGSQTTEGIQYIKFVFLMIMTDEGIRNTLLNEYGPEQKMDFCVHHMMDMMRAYNEEPYYPFEEQITRMANIMKSTADERIFGFVAFDPRRASENGDDKDSLILCERALALTKYFMGIKVYPPQGYSATDNVSRKPSEDEILYNYASIDKRLDDLYSHCANDNNDIPILAHCSAWGFQAYDCSGVLSSPEYWAKVLNKYPNLRLCYGHGGSAGGKLQNKCGGETYPGWCTKDATVTKDSKNFTEMVIDHCRRYKNVYCDLSYLAEVFDKDGCADIFLENLTRAYADDDKHPIDDNDPLRYKFAEKVMYGSDWHMPAMAFRAGKYLDFMVDAFDKTFPGDENSAKQKRKDLKNKFFYINASKFLKLI